jgi:hypothetical protein
MAGQSRAAGDDLSLPDKVILKEGAALPPFTTEREIDCIILEETGEKVVFNASRKKGVEERREVSLNDVEKVVHGDPSTRAFDLIRNRLALPPDSLNEAFYLNAISVCFEPFLKQNPGSSHRAEVENAIKAYREEGARIRQGDVRVGDTWYDAVTYQKQRPDLQAKECLARLNQAVKGRRLEQFAGTLNEIDRYKGSAIYPDLVESARQAIPGMEKWISSDTLQEKTEQEITSLETEIERQTAIVSRIVNQEPASQQNNWIKDPNMVHVESVNAWYDQREINTSDFTAYFTDTTRPRLKLDPVSKERVEQYIAKIASDKATLKKMGDSLSKGDDTISDRKKVLEQYAKAYEGIDVEALRAVQKDVERIEAGLVEKSPDTPSYDDYAKALEKEGKKPAAAVARLKAVELSGLADAMDDPDARREIVNRFIAGSGKAVAFVAGEKAKLKEDEKIWPENYGIIRLNEAVTATNGAAYALSRKAYEQVLELPFSEKNTIYNEWLGNRKAEAGVVLDLVAIDVQAASDAIKDGDSWRAIELIERIRSVTPTNPVFQELSRQAYARLNEYLDQGMPVEAARFLPVMSAAWETDPSIQEAGAKFKWIHLWGYSAAVNQPRVIITAVIFFFVGIALIGFLTGVVVKFLRRFKR